MKIKYGKIANDENNFVAGKCVYRFEIVDSITKTHYKELAKMSMLFNKRQRNTGFIKIEDEQAFLNLVNKIENSNDKRCTASHKKAIETARKRRNEISFEEYIEEHLDMHLALMTDKEKSDAYQTYKTIIGGME